MRDINPKEREAILDLCREIDRLVEAMNDGEGPVDPNQAALVAEKAQEVERLIRLQ